MTLQNKSFFLPLTLWIAAFICALYPVNTFQLEWFMGAVLLIFGWMVTMLFRDVRTGWEVPRASVLTCMGLFWTLVLCSVFWSEIKPVSLISMCFFSVLPLAFFGGVMAGKEEYFKKVAWVLGGIFAVLSVWAVVQFFFLDVYFRGQARHPLADPSSLGALLSLALFCALGLSVSSRPAREKLAGAVLAVLLVCGIMATVSRGPIFALLPALLVFVLLLRAQVKTNYKPLLAVLVGMAVFVAIPQTGLNKLDIGKRLGDTVTGVTLEKTLAGEKGGELRPLIWKSSFEMIKKAPLLGRGAGTFFLYYPEYRSPDEKDGVYMAHNDPLQFWVELGILGPLLFYGFAILCVLRTLAALKKTPQDGQDRVVIVSIFAALVALFVHSHVSFNHYNLSILMLEGLLLSVWFLATGRALAEEKRLLVLPDNLPHNLDKLLVVLPFLMMGWLFLSVTGGDYYANKARDALFRQDMTAFANDINKAGQVSMGLNFRAYLFAVNVPLAILEDRKSTLNEDQQKKLFDQIADYMDKAMAINPRAASAYFYMAKVQELVPASVLPADIRTAEDLYKQALVFDPMHLGARMALLKLYEQEGRSIAHRIAILKPGYKFRYNTEQVQDYYGALARLYLESGNTAKAQEVMVRAINFKKRSDYSWKRQNMSLPQAVMGGNQDLYAP